MDKNKFGKKLQKLGDSNGKSKNLEIFSMIKRLK